jgi:uncharacterized membrane protein YhaH (DUF805 family)
MINLHVRRRDRYACRCGRFRLSYRALRLGFFLMMLVILITLVVVRAVRRKATLLEILAEAAITLVALFVPSI